MLRKGFKQWVDEGFPRDPQTGAVDPDKYLRRGRDAWVAVTWDEVFDYSARAMTNIAETYTGPEGQQRLLAQGYDPLMVQKTEGAGTQVLKFRGGMQVLGATRIMAQYRLANSMALLDNKIRGVGPDKAIGARGWDNYTWHTDLPPGHPQVTGQQTVDFDLCNVEHSNLILVWGMNWICTKMPDSHCLTEARMKGSKVVVIAVEYSATMIKADEAFIVRPGTTPLLKLASDVGLADNINKHVQLLKWHAPYHESDHVLNFAANALCNGTRLQHLELLRNNAAYLDAIGADSIPDPTTAGDFCRRFKQSDIDALLLAINETRLNVWKQQEASFFEQAIIDVDGVIVTTKGEFKGGMDITFKGSWGYHPLLISLANTKEVMGLKYRSISSSFDADSKRWISSSFSST